MWWYAAYEKQQKESAVRQGLCSCSCHPGPFMNRPQREEHSHYCAECNAERFLPFTELAGLDT